MFVLSSSILISWLADYLSKVKFRNTVTWQCDNTMSQD